MQQRVLVIDDSPDIHALLEARLRPEGVAILHAHSPDEGLAMARAHRPDLILLDVEMPGRTGFEVCAELKSEPLTDALPVIFLTGLQGTYDKVRGFDLGAVDYVTKPFEPAELRARVRSALRTRRLLDLLSTRASVDGLTGLYNRAWFDRRLAELCADPRPSALLMIDIDRFKSINDQHGHPVGDRVIVSVAERVARAARPADGACRYGGEEFAVLLEGTTHRDAVRVAEAVISSVRELSLRAGAAEVRPRVSVGVGCTAELGRDPAAFVATVDRALYTAKLGGRDRFVEADRPASLIEDSP